MVAGEDFLLKWNDHHALFFAGAEELVSAEEYTDVTLAAGTRFFAAHRLVLSICSPYFRQLFKRLGGEKTVIFLKDVEPKHLELLLEYMYKGEIKVEETELVNVLNTAQSLEIRGLTDSGQKSDPPSKSKSSTTSSSTAAGGKRPAAASSPPAAAAASSNHHHTESHATAAAPARKRAKVAPAAPAVQQHQVKVKAEELDLRDEEDDVIQLDSTSADNDWNAVGGAGGSGVVKTDSSSGGGVLPAAVAAVRATGGGVVVDDSGDPDYDDQDYGGGDSGTVATGYEEMGYEGEDYYTEDGMMQMGEGDDRVWSEGWHTDPFTGQHACDFCGKTGGSLKDLRKHIRRHTKDKPYPCRHCNKGFSDPSNRIKHERHVHLGVPRSLPGLV